MKRSQFFSAELVTSITLFISLILLIVLVWNDKREEIESKLLIYSLEYNSADITELLVTSPGRPINWTVSNVEQLGLADDYNIINPKKLDSLFYMSVNNYTTVKELLGIPNYDYTIIIEDLNNNVLRSFGNRTQGLVVIFQENVLLNGSIVRFKVGVAD